MSPVEDIFPARDTRKLLIKLCGTQDLSKARNIEAATNQSPQYQNTAPRVDACIGHNCACAKADI
jgi:hypothetical protein